MIDFHGHIGSHAREFYPEQFPLTVEQVLDRMNRTGVDISVLQPLESPEGGWGYALTEDIVAARNAYPERFVAFVCVDPRYPKACQLIDHFVKNHGCKGFGEHVNGLTFDHELNRAIYAKCDELGLPLCFGDDLGCYDEPGLPRLEGCLRDYRNVQFCGHGPGFWSAISGDDDRSIAYPNTPVKPGGALDRLLGQYDNLWLDLSAGSGYNALSRDPDFTMGFVQRHWRKMLWGTDYCVVHQQTPQVQWIAKLEVAPEVKQAISDGNARSLLGL